MITQDRIMLLEPEKNIRKQESYELILVIEISSYVFHYFFLFYSMFTIIKHRKDDH